MARVFKLGLLVLLFPVVAYLVAQAVQNKIDGSWRDYLTENVDPRAADNPQLALSNLCGRTDPPGELSKLCWESGFAVQTLVKGGAVATAGAGVGLLGLIALLGRLASRNRRAVVRLFGAGLSITLVTVLALVLLHSSLTLSAIYYGMAVFVERIPTRLLLFVGLGGLYAAFQMLRSTLALFRKVKSGVLGRVLSPEQHPALWQFVTDLAGRVGTAPPDQIIGGLEPNFFVTEAETAVPDGDLNGRTLYVSLPLCHILTRGELGAIIGHELAHFHGEDTLYSQRFYPIYRGAAGALAAVANPIGGSSSAVVLLPSALILSYFLDAFAQVESAISRDREFVADAVGAQLAGRESTGAALVKVHAFAKVWQDVNGTMVTLLAEGRQLTNASAQFVAWARELSTPDALADLDARKMPHPTDSHPPLSQRLAALRLRLENVQAAALQTAPEDSAIRLLGDVAELERRLSALEHHVLVQSGRATVPDGALAGAD